MIIKNADDKSTQIAELESYLADPHIASSKKSLIEKELIMVRAGLKGEREAGYEIDFNYGTSEHHAVIHDLRLEYGGRVAQIDHLVINRLLEIFILETKHFAEGVSVNEHGEFTAWYGGRPKGIPSPFEQNMRHVRVMQDVLDTLLSRPTRLGVKLPIALEPVVLVSKHARVGRPKGYDTSRLIKADQLVTWCNRHADALTVLSMWKVVSMDTVASLAKQLAALHVPMYPNYRAKFGLGEGELSPKMNDTAKLEKDAVTLPSKEPVRCQQCDAPVSYPVIKFCRMNKGRFGGNVYCQSCQKEH